MNDMLLIFRDWFIYLSAGAFGLLFVQNSQNSGILTLVLYVCYSLWCLLVAFLVQSYDQSRNQ